VIANFEKGKMLRVFIGESDRHDGRPLHEWIVLEARRRGLAGATVLRCEGPVPAVADPYSRIAKGTLK
jgi:PII-like signaling protein